MKIQAFILFLFFSSLSIAQNGSSVDEATKLLGELTDIRGNFDVQFYHLDIEVKPEEKSIAGHNTIQFIALTDIKEVQIDLFENMNVSKITQGNTELNYERKYHSIFIDLAKEVKNNQLDSITVFYDGKPTEAKNAPWDGGFVWKVDSLGKPFIGVAVEGLGASSWWPNKDHLTDEPDNGVQVEITVPKELKAISNGRMIGSEEVGDDKKKYIWRTFYPVDNYNVTLNIGDYVNYKEYYEGIPDRNNAGEYIQNSGKNLDIDYYILSYHLEQAKKHFTFTEDVLSGFEYAFGPYPFYEDGFAIIEAPYLGMEHQGAIAYGNNFKMGWNGVTAKPYLEFDYLFVHETAHEWWGNNVSMNDRANMWIQESFATYADAFYVFSMYGYEGYLDYMDHYKTLVKNERPILGPEGENFEPPLDQYYKGALMLNTLSQLVDNNEDWLNVLRKAQIKFRAPYTVSTEEFIQFMEEETRLDLDAFFKQYLETTDIPKLVARLKKDGKDEYIIYKWTNVVEGFEMPVKLRYQKYEQQWVYPTAEWKKLKLPKGYDMEFLTVDERRQYFELDFKNEE